MAKRVKTIEDIPEDDLKAMIAVFKNDGAQVGYKKQENGKYTLEAMFEDTASPDTGTIKSFISDDRLKPG